MQFIALHKDLQPTGAEWPAMKAQHDYWSEAAQYIKDAAETEYLREGTMYHIVFIYTIFWVMDACNLKSS